MVGTTGLRAYEKVQPAKAHVRGLTNSFGVFETYYIETLLTDSTSSAIAWIGSIQLFLTMIIGVFAGVLLDAGHLRLLIVLGTFFEVFGMMMTSLCTEYWQILLAQAICTGIGSGLLGLTSVAVIPLYFSSRRMIATGIAATGSSLGVYIVSTLRTDYRNLADRSNSGYNLPDHAAASLSQSRFPLGSARSGFLDTGPSIDLLCRNEA